MFQQTADFDITSANAVGILTVDGLFPSGIELLMFGTDQAVNQDSIDITETRMGVDGHMVAGVVGTVYPVTLTLEAPSPSTASLITVWNAYRTNLRPYECTLTFILPSIRRAYTWRRGVMKSGVPFASVKKVLDPTTWLFHFESMDVASLG